MQACFLFQPVLMECLGTTALCFVAAHLTMCVAALMAIALPISACRGGVVRPAKGVSCKRRNFSNILQNYTKYIFKYITVVCELSKKEVMA